MTGNIKVNKGLAGVITDDTSVSKVMAETNSLTYRGCLLYTSDAADDS